MHLFIEKDVFYNNGIDPLDDEEVPLFSWAGRPIYQGADDTIFWAPPFITEDYLEMALAY